MKKIMAMATAALLCLSINADDLTVPSGTTHSVGSNEDYGTVTLQGGTVSLNAAQLKCQTVNATANSTIRFNTGKLAASSWDKYWFQPSSGSTLTLESVDGNDIYLDVGYQRHNFSTGAGTVATTGSGDIVVNSLKSGSDRMYLTFTAGNVTWGHSGNLRAVGQGGLRLLQGGALPSGSSTGGIKLEGSTELYLESLADSQVNSIEGSVRSIGWSWLKFGNYKDGTFKNAPDVGGVCNVEKYGVGTTLTLDNTGFTMLDVKNGTVVATGGATTIKDLSMNADTTLNVIDTTFSATNSAALKGATTAVAVGASGVFDAVGGSDASFLLDSAGSVVKRGAGTWNVYPSQTFSGRLQVSGGTLKFRYKEQQSCANDQWWRISITKQAYQTKGVTLAEIGLFAGGGGGVSTKTCPQPRQTWAPCPMERRRLLQATFQAALSPTCSIPMPPPFGGPIGRIRRRPLRRSMEDILLRSCCACRLPRRGKSLRQWTCRITTISTITPRALRLSPVRTARTGRPVAPMTT